MRFECNGSFSQAFSHFGPSLMHAREKADVMQRVRLAIGACASLPLCLPFHCPFPPATAKSGVPCVLSLPLLLSVLPVFCHCLSCCQCFLCSGTALTATAKQRTLYLMSSSF